MNSPAISPTTSLKQLVHARAFLAQGVLDYGDNYLPLYEMFDRAVEDRKVEETKRQAMHATLARAIREDERATV